MRDGIYVYIYIYIKKTKKTSTVCAVFSDNVREKKTL